MVWYGCEVMSLWNMKQKKKLCTGYIAYKNGNRKQQKKNSRKLSFQYISTSSHEYEEKENGQQKRKNEDSTLLCEERSMNFFMII